jgi:hypothetical protein
MRYKGQYLKLAISRIIELSPFKIIIYVIT